MTGTPSCPRCGAPRLGNAPDGLCPRCLLMLGLGVSRDAAADAGDSASLRATPFPARVAARGGGPTGVAWAPEGRDLADAHPSRGGHLDGPCECGHDPGHRDAAPSGGAARYRVYEEIARGGMGVVHRGRDVELGRDVALKVLREEYGHRPEAVGRFVREAQIGGQLQHPGIVPVYEVGRLPDSRPFIAMKLVEGRTLAELLHERGAPSGDLPRLLAIFQQVCQTMAYAHDCGAIHRDLKPANVMVGNFGEVQVMDWGLAKIVDEGGIAEAERSNRVRDKSGGVRTPRGEAGGGGSRAGSVLGTAAYMAPEQARGHLDLLDERADVFGLGAILCEILTGEPPYAGGPGDDLHAKAERADLASCLARLRACEADGDLVAIASACLAPAPRDRPRDAGVVAAKLTAYLAGMRERLRAAELAQARAELRAAEERRRRVLTVGLAASLLAAAALGLGWAVWLSRERAERVEGASRAVIAAAYEASSLLSRARAANDADLARWAEASRAVEQAKAAAERPEVRPEQRRQVMELAAAAARDRRLAEAAIKDRHMVDRLGQIHADFALHFRLDRTDSEYLAAFRDYGVEIDGPDPAEAGALLAASPVATELANALDQWTFLRRRQGGPRSAAAGRLVAIAKVADPDPWRNRLRDTLHDAAADRAQAVEALRKLAATADAERLPEASVTRLAWALAAHRSRGLAIELLRRAQRVHPDNFWLNMDLAGLLAKARQPEEAVRFYSVAQSIRPDCEMARLALAEALRAAGRPEEALGYPQALQPRGGLPVGAPPRAARGPAKG
ncbi:Serine/threonine-protein kinase PknB [Aquisphaera giovannonii]|uniref:Serine/threonine-protein kinase PknB n=1 Tax=Aquisphaera giovannonii TaxID=406548 RepID=A0A5B9W8L9_9BACT|nr:serine/threonine-protein kinase [Aquisphaera giovannonii]QEH36260.1 Serine/threonine-protein kinase PknB [Aquisphaera giovannonii]